MTSKPLFKLLSVILTIAICATTVFGCIIAANALNTPEYVIQGSKCDMGTSAASATVTFTMPEGMGAAAGTFTIDNTDDWYKEVTPSVVKADESDIIDMFAEDGVILFQIYDSESSPKLYETITVNLDFVFKDGGITESIRIKLTDVELNGIYSTENYTNVADNSTDAYFSVGCQHVYAVSGDPAATSEKHGYSVYNSATCTLCGETKADYQVVPEVKLSDQVSVYTASFITDISALEGSGTESEPYIIKTADQFASVALGKVTNYAAGSYFKVADGIKSFYMNGGETLANMTTAADVKAYFEEYGGYGWASSWDRYTAGKSFCGHFDGSGVTIYGLYDDVNDGTDGLFEAVEGTTTLSNFTLKNSYFAANSGAGVAPILTRTSSASDTADTVTIEKVSVVNNYIAQTGDRAQGACAIAGYLYSGDKININNCIIYGNNIDNSKYTGSALNTGLICFVNDGNTAGSVQINNIISLGVIPVTSNGGSYYRALSGSITNIYTDMDCSTVVGSTYTDANKTKYNFNDNIALSDLQGAKAEITADALDWNTDTNPDGVWFTGNAGQYPSLFKKNILPVADATNSAWKLLGTNIVYADDGSFALNFHYEPAYDSDAKLYVANMQSENKTKILTEHTASSFAGTILSNDARMFTLSGLSAKDIDILWLPTIITTNKTGNEIVYGETSQISVGGYAESVVLGDAVYSEGATDAQKAADVNVAAALINYGKASADALAITTATSDSGIVVSYSGSASEAPGVSLLDSTKENSETNPYIIELPTQLHALTAGALKNDAGENVSEIGAYFKVKDGIKAFVMQSESKYSAQEIMSLSSWDEVYNKLDFATTGKQPTIWWPSVSGSSGKFSGHFDGNGVEIYGLYSGVYDAGGSNSNARGLFTTVYGDSSFKNFSIKNSYIATGSWMGAGAVIGSTGVTYVNTATTVHNVDRVTIENCEVSNNYIAQLADNQSRGASALIGMSTFYTVGSVNYHDEAVINNCLIYGNNLDNSAYENATGSKSCSGLISYGGGSDGTKITNVIALGTTPWTLNGGGWYIKQIGNGSISNVYTDATQDDWDAFAATNTSNNTAANATKYNINYAIDANAFKGITAKTTASVLDWDTIWMYGDEGEYPSIVLAESKVNPVSEYSGTPDTTSTLEGSGTAEDPYIIETADQFAAIALGKRTSTEDTYYKVKDGVKSFYMQGGDAVADMTSVEQVKAYFEQNSTPTSSTWTKTNTFTGQFDGNGVTIYGLYCYNIGQYVYSGLFPQVTGHSSIKNITLKNSYISSDCGDGLGAIVGATVWVSGGADENSVEFENIAVINNYICQRRATASGASAIGGNFFNSNYATVNNAIVYGNIIDNSAYTGTGLLSGLFTANGGINSSRSDDAEIQNVIALGVTPWLLKQTGDNTYSHTNWNLANVSSGVYKNIYTDQSVAALQTYNSSNNSDANLSKYNINVVSPSSLQGENAVSTTASAGFDWNTTWFAGNYNDYPSFAPTGALPSSVQPLYNDIVLDTVDNYGDSTTGFGVYATSLNLNSNPYMSFAFEFGGEYKENRDKITVKFTYTVNGTEYTHTTTPPAFTGDGTINGTDNWYNRPSAGRFHTYRFKDVPVEALANPIKVEASYNGGGYVNFGTFSVEGLALEFERSYRLNPCDYYATRIEAVKALLFYTQMIHARYGAQ